ncbi:serine-rich adhesin for platelets [Anopheles cruzii]|uniref:serine-rich adhesin for platelets n=1 Tax=Anopheles cruzii TaxID=68878 RepID=UPI0022EC4B67|nr:serine-rich adhesin for platelets [Anopheles cruzii]
MAHSLAIVTLMLAFLSLSSSAEGRVIVRRQAEDSLVPGAQNNITASLGPEAVNGTSPPRPNDRFEQFPVMGEAEEVEGLRERLGSSGDEVASLGSGSFASADLETDELTSSAADTASDDDQESSRDEDDGSLSIMTTTTGPVLSDETREELNSGSGSLDDESVPGSNSGSLSANSQLSNESLTSSVGSAGSDSNQQSESDDDDEERPSREDSTEAPITAAAISEITTSTTTTTTVAGPSEQPTSATSTASTGTATGNGSRSVELPTTSGESSAQLEERSDDRTADALMLPRMDDGLTGTVTAGTEQPDGVAHEEPTSAPQPQRAIVDEVEPATTTVSSGESEAVEAETLSPSTGSEDDLPAPGVERFELSRYTSPSNFSDGGGIALNDNERSSFDFDGEDTSATGSSAAGDEESVTEEPTATTTPADETPVLDTIRANESTERNSSRTVERAQLETSSYEIVSNEVTRNASQPPMAPRTKKGKFLDQFNEETTEDNDINVPNGAAWALAGMRMVDRKQSDTPAPERSESTEVARDATENMVANNTLKQLMDWAIIMQQADFANSSFVRSTVASDEAGSESKDRRTYANKVPNVDGVGDVLSEENRLTAVVTESAPGPDAEGEELNGIDTTFAPSTERPVRQGIFDLDAPVFGFKERASSTTTVANEIASSSDGGPILPTTTRRSYEVSEMVDESDVPRVRITPEATTTINERMDTSTLGAMEDMPVTTYSPSVSILRRIEQTTTTVPLTTIISRMPTTVPSRRTVTTQEYVTTTDAAIRETTTGPSSPVTTTLLPVRAPGSEPPAKPFDQDSTDSTEVNLNQLNRTDERMVTATVSVTATAQPTISSVTLTNNVELDDTSAAGESLLSQVGFTTERTDLSQFTTEEVAEDGGKVPIVVEEKHLYDTITTTTNVPALTTTTTTTTVPSTTSGSLNERYTTRRTIDRSMTTTELSGEESVTEEDYIELTNPSNGAPADAKTGTVGVTGVPKQAVDGATEQSQGEPAAEEDNSVVVAVVASIVSVIVVLLLIAAFMYYPPLQIVFRKRQNQVSYGQRCRPVGLDAYSLDNVSVYNSVRRKGNAARMSKRSYGNSAFEDPNFKTNPLTVAELANIIQNKTAIYDEFKEIPNVTARADEVPEGCEDKNRYANVVPLPETRVNLKRLNDDEKTEYINANFVKGPKDGVNYYIACQAPMENTINDFWRMVWEQNSKVIIMATDLSENGVEKCAEYLPPSVVLDNSRTFGDFQLTLKNRENKEKYTISTVHMRHTPSNNLREIMHFWYQWPDTGVPIDESSIIGMLLEARTFLKLSPSELAEFATIVEENESPEAEPQPPVVANGTDSTHNNNNNNNNAASNGTPAKEPASIVSNGGTMDKHKSLQRTQGPLTVHCSPGTGRTGTLVACDVALRLLEIPPRTVDVPQIVYYVRRGRASAVRTREQYDLIYRVANVYATKLTGPTIET